ncbi:MAG TPA: hypothetical protein VMS64_25725 [Candidatus Methylomirabilis sp.]|nr:hypothetical protein [Candidatus Methylomirabilis sp.]
MKIIGKMLSGSLVLFSVLLLGASSRTEAAVVDHAGLVVAVDRNGGTVAVGDMGPLLSNGTSEITRYTMRVTPSTEFVRVQRASGVAPSGWVGDYVETKLRAWDVKPGDFVAVVTEGQGQQLRAVKIIVVEPSEP